MQINSLDIVSPKIIKAITTQGLEKKMREMILRTGKKYDFYFFMKDGADFLAFYREEINLEDEVKNELPKR